MTTTSSSTPTTALNASLKDTKRHACSSFEAGDEVISIIPSYTCDNPLGLMSKSNMKPLHAGMPARVPLWLALLLHQKSLARIVTPDWMEVDLLKQILKGEQETESFSKTLPFHYLEISRSLLRIPELHPSQEKMRILLQDIQTVRMDKIRRNLHILSEQSLQSPYSLPIIDVTGIASLEIAAIEPFIRTAFAHHLKLSKREELKKKDATDTSSPGIGEAPGGAPLKHRAASRLRRFRN